MNKQMIEVMQRRADLLARIAVQREQVAEISSRWQTPLALADQGLAAVHYARSHPVLIGGVVALIAARRRGVVGMVQSAWRVWRAYRIAATFATKISSRF